MPCDVMQELTNAWLTREDGTWCPTRQIACKAVVVTFEVVVHTYVLGTNPQLEGIDAFDVEDVAIRNDIIVLVHAFVFMPIFVLVHALFFMPILTPVHAFGFTLILGATPLLLFFGHALPPELGMDLAKLMIGW